MDQVLLGLILVYAIVAPFTKVEESFNLQAIHDIVYYGNDLAKYDHIEFSGPIPRTFVGALALATAIKPVEWFMTLGSKADLQIIARGLLGAINALALCLFRHSLEDLYATTGNPGQGKAISYWFMALLGSQFHIIYYASRTLPNMLALPLVVEAFRNVLTGYYGWALGVLGFAAIVFRIELVVLAGSLALVLHFTSHFDVRRSMRACAIGVLLGGSLSAYVDSYYWAGTVFDPRVSGEGVFGHAPIIIPEINGFIFNVIEGRSSEWGESPFFAYFMDLIPLMLNNPIIYGTFASGVLVGISKAKSHTERARRDNKIRVLGAACLLYVFIYSFKAHKEWRFVIYVSPVATMIAARVASSLWMRMDRSWRARIQLLGIILVTVASFCLASFKLAVSSLNYPGGLALQAFNNEIVPAIQNTTSIIPDRPIEVHLDVPVCMTGASRFGQVHNDTVVHYDKTETVAKLELIWPSFDYVVTTMPDPSVFPSVEGYTWEQVKAVRAFKQMDYSIVRNAISYAKSEPQQAAKDFLHGVTTRLLNFNPDQLIAEARQLFNSIVIIDNQAYIYQKTPSRFSQ